MCSPGTTMPCYSGDPATKGVGICSTGVATCNDNGTEWGACMGETTAAAKEDCVNNLDDDCNGQVNDGCPCSPGAVSGCYDGPPGTEGNGICKAGTHTCNPDGMGFGACTGEVQPGTEDCYTPGDEDCDGIPCSDALWAKHYGVSGASTLAAIASDLATGDVYVTGTFADVADLGCGAMTAGQNEDGLFLGRLHADGECVWTRAFMHADGMYSSPDLSIAVDDDGNVALSGRLLASVNFGGSDLIGGFVAFFDANGQHVWSRGCGNWMKALAFDHANDLVVAGYGANGMDCGGGPLGAGVALSKYHNGDTVFSKSFASSGSAYAQAIAFDSQNNIFLAGGQDQATINLGGGTLSPSGTSNIFLAKLTPAGDHIWSHTYGVSGVSQANAVSTDSTGAVVVVGYFTDSLIVGNTTLSSAGAPDALAFKVSGAGTPLWAKSYGDGSFQSATSVASDHNGHLYLVGSNDGVMDFGGVTLTASGPLNLFVAKVAESDASTIWAKEYPGAVVDAGVASAADHGCFVGGSFSQPLDFGTVPAMTPVGGPDSFLARIAP